MRRRAMDKNKRNQNIYIVVPICMCAILVIVNLFQCLQFYKVLGAIYKMCRDLSGTEKAIVLMEYTNNLETDTLLNTGLTIISIAVTIWIGLNIYNVVNKEELEKTLEISQKRIQETQNNYIENIRNTLKNYDKRIDDLDEERVKRLRYLTRKVEFINLLYLTGNRYYASDFFANLFWNTSAEYSNIDNIIKSERRYIQCCIYYENNEKKKTNRLACDLIIEYKKMMLEPPYTTCPINDPMKNFVRMRLSDSYFYKNMTMADINEFNKREAEISIQYYQEIIENKSEIKAWDDEILAYFYNSQGYTRYHIYKHTLFETTEDGIDYLKKTLNILEDAVSKAPYKGRYKRNLGLVYQALDDYNEARKNYKEASEDDPLDYKAYNAVVALDLKEFDKKYGISNRSETLLNKIVFTDKMQEECRKHIDEDIMFCQTAEKICFSFIDTHFNMAKAYLYKYLCEGRSDAELLRQAHEQIDIAEKLNPNVLGTLYVKRNIYEAEGNFEKAYEYAEMIGSKGDNDTLIKIYETLRESFDNAIESDVR